MSVTTGRLRRGFTAPLEILTGRRHVYYGWWLLAGSVVAMALGSGVSFWALTLYVEPLEQEFGWSRAQVTGAISVSLGCAGLSSPLIGRWIDARGPRSAILVGGTLTAVTYLLMATTSSLWEWYVYSSINAVFRQLMFFLPFQALVSRFFDRRRGIALGILGTGFSMGGLFVVPAVAFIIETVGWAGSFVISAAIILAVFVPIGTFLVRNTPADVGDYPDGTPPEPGTETTTRMLGLTLGQALKTPNFWALGLAMMLFFIGLFGWLVHQVPFYESAGFSTQTASLFVSLYAGFAVVVRLGFGFTLDSIRSVELAAMTLGVLMCAAMTTLFVSTAGPAIGLFIIFYVFGAGGAPMMEAMLLTRAFGVAHFATIFGVFFLFETVGQVTSPVIAGAIYDATGSYDLVLLMWMGTFAGSAALFFLASRLPRPVQEVEGR